MSIRICAGSYRSRRINCPPRGVRPTTDRVKEAIFSTLGGDCRDLAVLDLFAGCGNLGIEALSRGAAHCTFVDASTESIRYIRNNLESLDAAEQATVLKSSAQAFLEHCPHRYDLVFMDPPYNKGLASLCAPQVYNLLKRDGMLIVEHDPGELIDMPAWKERHYGATVVSYYVRSDSCPNE